MQALRVWTNFGIFSQEKLTLMRDSQKQAF